MCHMLCPFPELVMEPNRTLMSALDDTLLSYILIIWLAEMLFLLRNKSSFLLASCLLRAQLNLYILWF